MGSKKSLIHILLTALMLMVVVFYNGFPLTENDTGAYIECGIKNIIPQDRSVFYAWFLRYTSMWSSLWYTVIAQCLLTAWLLHRLMKVLLGERHLRDYLLISALIVSFTCVSWVSGFLMPDIFAALLLLAIILLFTDKASQAWVRVLYVLVIFISVVVHNSHFLILGLFGAVLAFWFVVKRNVQGIKNAVALVGIAAMSWALACGVNYAYGYGFTYSRGTHAFMVTKFAETGILSRYLDENCDVKRLKICQYKDDIPDFSWDFLWGESSAFYKAGGWDSTKEQFDIIVHDVLTTPKYLRMFIQKSAVSTMRQLTHVHTAEHASVQGLWSSSCQRVATYFPDEQNEFMLSRQFSGELSAGVCNKVYLLFFVFTTVVLLWRRGVADKDLAFIYGVILLFFVLNAFVTSVGSTVLYRYQYRIFWILPALNTIFLARLYWKERLKREVGDGAM